MKRAGIFSVMALLLGTIMLGCNANPGADGSTGKRAETQTYGNGRSPVNGLLGIGNNSAPDGTYDKDGYLGYTWSNPNLGIGRSDVNYGVLSRQMARAAGRVPGVEDANVSINGGTANVAIDVERAYRGDPERVREHVYHVLSRQMPRYNINVKVNQGRGTFLRSRSLDGTSDNEQFRDGFRGEANKYGYEMRKNINR